MDSALAPILDQPRYRQLLSKWQSLWRLEDVARPCWLLNTAPALWPLLTGQYPLMTYFGDKTMQARAQIEALQWRESVDVGDMFVPHVQPMGGVTVFASAYGCQVQFFPHTLPWAHAVIGDEDPPENVYKLPRPEVTSGQLGQMLEITDYLVQQTHNRYPVAITDMQGPMDTAYLVWNSTGFMVAMYTNPEEVHHLLRSVTDLIIRYVKEQRSRSRQFVACHYPPMYLPDGEGIAISDDALAVLSPHLYEQFGLPYVNALSEEFGGIFIHSCGNFVHQLGNLEKVRGLRGLNFGASETPFEAVWERFNGKTVIAPHVGLNKDIHFDGNLEFAEHILRAKTHNRGLIILMSGDNKDLDVLSATSVSHFATRLSDLFDRYA